MNSNITTKLSGSATTFSNEMDFFKHFEEKENDPRNIRNSNIPNISWLGNKRNNISKGKKKSVNNNNIPGLTIVTNANITKINYPGGKTTISEKMKKKRVMKNKENVPDQLNMIRNNVLNVENGSRAAASNGDNENNLLSYFHVESDSKSTASKKQKKNNNKKEKRKPIDGYVADIDLDCKETASGKKKKSSKSNKQSEKSILTEIMVSNTTYMESNIGTQKHKNTPAANGKGKRIENFANESTAFVLRPQRSNISEKNKSIGKGKRIEKTAVANGSTTSVLRPQRSNISEKNKSIGKGKRIEKTAIANESTAFVLRPQRSNISEKIGKGKQSGNDRKKLMIDLALLEELRRDIQESDLGEYALADVLRLESINWPRSTPPLCVVIDLHGFTGNRAKSLLNEFKNLEPSLKHTPRVRFITGTALTRDKPAVLKPLVKGFLEEAFPSRKIYEQLDGHIDLKILRGGRRKKNHKGMQKNEDKDEIQSDTRVNDTDNKEDKSQNAKKTFKTMATMVVRLCKLAKKTLSAN